MSSRRLAQTWPFERHKTFEDVLRCAAAGWFSQKGLATKTNVPYCLPSFDDWPQNIICPDVAEYIQQERDQNLGEESFPLHKYLHHGLSSQAMVFNLVGPLIVRGDFSPLREVMEQAGIAWPNGEIHAEFEYDDREIFNEDSGQPTSIDLVIHQKGKSDKAGGIFIEAKLREEEFGNCSIFSGGDCDGRNPVLYGLGGCYLHHIGRKYWDLMEKFGFGEAGIASGPICPFTVYYQFFREILFALEEDGYFVLLHDERNLAFRKIVPNGKELGLWSFLKESVSPKYADRIGRITIQQLANAIEDSGKHKDWIGEFKQKYGIE